jgi:hypothetical protein
MVFAGPVASLPPMLSPYMLAGVQYAGTPFIPFYQPEIVGFARTTVQKASTLGCVLDCVATTGLTASGGTPIDDHALLQAFLNTASAGNPIKLIMDGCAYLSAGLVVNSYTTIEGIGWQSGFYLASGVNQNVLTIGATGTASGLAGAYNQPLPVRTASNIVLRDFTINPNGVAQSSDGFAVLIVNTVGVLVDHVNFLQAYYFALTVSNSSNIVVRGCSFTSAGTLHDGVHMDGPVEDVRISDCVFATGDDAIAVNCPEATAATSAVSP